MNSSTQRRLLTALTILLFLLLLWVLSAVQLDPTAAENLHISISLQPRFGDSGEGGRSLAAITLTIISDLVQDLQLSLYDPGPQGRTAQRTPSPTVAVRDAQDGPSPAPTDTLIPTDTPLPTPEPSGPTSTPETPTPTPTARAEPSAFTSTPDPTLTDEPDDEHGPELSEGELDIADGSTISCEQQVHVSDLRVFDPAYSEGIKWVKLKYKIEGSSRSYVYSDKALELTSGGWTGSEETEWDGRYEGSIVIDFEEGWAIYAGPKALARAMVSSDETPTPTPTEGTLTSASPTPTPTPTPDPEPSDTPTSTPTKTRTATPDSTPTATPTPAADPYTVQLWALAKDNDGHSGAVQLATYTMVCP